VREKRFWIYTKLAEKEALRSEAPPKRYVSGEGFAYLVFNPSRISSTIRDGRG
jgi:hypothetical protein